MSVYLFKSKATLIHEAHKAKVRKLRALLAENEATGLCGSDDAHLKLLEYLGIPSATRYPAKPETRSVLRLVE